ncbi:MAG: cell surface protein [Acidovorax sp.]|uniref:cell surface protein n=1 Tax=Acidovorax sp. TaxID=1872122 RepID=UPI00391BD844
MKKNVLALSIAAMVGGFAGVAQADVFAPAVATPTGAVLGTNVAATPDTVGANAANATILEVNSNNVGHMLVVPYYTAQNGNMSVIHLSNTDRANGKAVKIRFRGAANSDDVKDFQIFMSPGDVWTGAVLQGADGAAVLYSNDKTCTVPAIPATGTPFATARLNTAANVNGTREGYVEIFNMADIPSVKLYTATTPAGGVVLGAAGTAASPLYTATKHVNGVAPCSVAGSAARSLLDEIALTSYTSGPHAASVGFAGSTTGLSADWYILNLAQTTAFSGEATAIEARVAAAGAAGAANFVHFPQTDAGSAGFFTGFKTADTYTADPLLRTNVHNQAKAAVVGPVVTPLFIDLPDMSTPYLPGSAPAGAAPDANLPKVQAVALTSALSRTSVSNQFALDAGITAQTDWVFSMPTRRYSVAANYKAATTAADAYRLYSDLSVAATAAGTPALTGLVDEWFHPANTSVDARGNICVNADSIRFFDREETTTGNAPIFSPAVAGQLSFCGETSVLSLSTGKVLSSSSDLTASTTTAPYTNGWTLVTTTNAFVGAANTVGFTGGLPILGDAFIKMKNDSAGQGFASTFGLTWGHRYGR